MDWDTDGWVNRRRWYEDEDMYVRRQRRVAEERAADSDARIQDQLRRVTAQKESLERQVARLGAAFDAFVELTAVRGALGAHGPAAAAREQARQLLAALVQGRPGEARAEAVQGYWLPQAANGLAFLVGGDAEAARSALAAAAGVDSQRTGLFLALALPLAGMPGLAVPWLERALGPAVGRHGQLTLAVREVWMLAGAGGYGDPGREVVVRWLAQAQDPEAVEELHTTLRPRPRGSEAEYDPARTFQARAAVRELAELGRLLRPVAPADSSHPVPSAALLDALIGEGAPEEAALLLRAGQLSAEVSRLRSGTQTEPEPRWDAPADDLQTLLLADLRGGSPLGTVAQQALSGAIGPLADRLLAEACPERPDRVEAKIDGQSVTLLVDQPLAPQLSQLDALVDQRSQPGQGNWLTARKLAAEAAEVAEERKAANREKARQAITAFTVECDKLTGLRQEAEQEHAALVARLAELKPPATRHRG
ncbi:hypothetical protein [Streptacidiphilus jiangxiensis]|uniref:Uncharacterized protein n=1 Tax=Streptacidiphilus jiangxiensis TaxID=235985 RepID=A0A1H7XLW6_STRJI|nr:hypothetical protein [Streptacidiphilus jiangxiensis]SEM34675.1 hypothetical protein SAMN05414137_12499 [Streptacidiphilus jiangxiensis]